MSLPPCPHGGAAATCVACLTAEIARLQAIVYALHARGASLPHRRVIVTTTLAWDGEPLVLYRERGQYVVGIQTPSGVLVPLPDATFHTYDAALTRLRLRATHQAPGQGAEEA